MPTELKLTWSARPASEGVTKYEVFQSKDNAPYTLIGSPNGTTHSVLNPLPGNYKFKVRAVNFVGNGPDSNIVEGPPVPGEITDLVLTVIVT